MQNIISTLCQKYKVPLTTEAETIENLLLKASEHYYLGKECVMEDHTYDALYDLLKRINPEVSIFKGIGTSPFRQSTFKTKDHLVPMTSLNKIHSYTELTKYFSNKDQFYCISEKIDGLAVSLHYKLICQHLHLVRALTRGDGHTGIDITENAKQIFNIPRVIELPENHFLSYITKIFEVRGEVYMTKSDFARVITDLDEGTGYKNPRNLAAGTLKSKDSALVAKRRLRFKAYDSNEVHGNYAVRLTTLQHLYTFDIVDHQVGTFTEIAEYYKTITNNRKNLDYDIDGVVVRVDYQPTYNLLGVVNMRPKGAVAWKFEAESAFTTVKDIEWNVSRLGTITPVCIFEPVELCGATLERASLANLNEVYKLQLTIGSTILVSRRNDVIPHVERVEELAAGETIPAPAWCPVCSHATVQKRSAQGIYTLHCSNDLCDAKIINKLTHFCHTLGMKGISTKLIEQLVDKDLVTNYIDLFKLTDADLRYSLDRVGNTSIQNILNTIESARDAEMSTFIVALGIKGIGKETARTLCEDIDDIKDIIDAAEHFANWGLGRTTQSTFSKWMSKHADHVLKLSTYFNFKKVKHSGCLNGKSFCLSGSFPGGKTEVGRLIIDHGGTIKTSVSKDLDYLVVGEGSGNKKEKAENYGISILTAKELTQLINREKGAIYNS